MRPVSCAVGLLLGLLAFPAAPARARVDDLLDCRDRDRPIALELSLARGDTPNDLVLTVNVSAGRGTRGYASWAVEPGDGLDVVGGETGDSGSPSDLSGRHMLELGCDHWGNFSLLVRALQRSDSLNSGLVARELRFRVTADSLVVDPDEPTTEQEWLVSGAYYRVVDCWWLPLDPGESASFDPDERLVSRPKAVRAVPGSGADLGARSGSNEARVIVAVDRRGHVKASRYMDLWPGDATPEAVRSALDAAEQWTFPPAVVDGQAVSAVYEIFVPLTAP